MRKILIISLFIIILCLTEIYPVIYTTPSYLESKNKIETGLSFGYSFDKSFETFLFTEFLISKIFSPILKIGYRTTEEYEKGFYAGIYAKVIIAEQFGGTDFLTLISGGYYCDNMFGIDNSIIIGNFFKNFDNYCGLNFKINLFKEKNTYPGYFVLGTKFYPLKFKIPLLLELGLPITSYSDYQISSAIKYKF